MKPKKGPNVRKAKDLSVHGRKARGIKGGVVRKAATTLSVPPPPAGPVPVPYPN